MFTTSLFILGLIIFAYLLGSVPNAVWIGKCFYGVDVRQHGSRNAGATNVLRVLGRKAALPVFILDGLKGYIAVLLSWFAPLISPTYEDFSEPFIILRITLIVAVVLGHIFPVFARFKGGKGVATITGALFAFATLPIICSFIVFIIVLSYKHYVSLGSICSGLTFPLFTILSPWMISTFHLDFFGYANNSQSPSMIIFSFVVAAALVLTHRKNIKRLLNGTESKVYILNRNRPQE